MSVEKIIVAGDWHGNARWARQVVREARRLGISRIVQVGDFGLWDHVDDGIEYLDELNMACRENQVTVRFLDGNHENHDRLKWYTANNPSNSVGQVFIRSHILYLPRGNRWQWGSRHLTAVGGAHSIDKAWRKPGRSWWEGEQLTDKQVEFSVPNGPIDFLFTHDCPTNAPFHHRLKEDPDSQIHRQRMNKVGQKVQPRIWFHGHMHERYEYEFQHRTGYAQVFGLEMDGNTFNWGVLDIDEAKFTWGVKYVG